MPNCTNDGCACTPNSAIKCTVTSCAHHCSDVNNCGLSSIQIVRASARSDERPLLPKGLHREVQS